MNASLHTLNCLADIALRAQAAAREVDQLSLDVSRQYGAAFDFIELARINAERGDLFAACRCLVYGAEHRDMARTLRRRRWS